MRPFAYARPTDPAEAVELATSTDGAMYLAGGTNLVDLMKLGATRPTMLVDVGGLGFDAVDELDGGGLRIGGGRTATWPATRRPPGPPAAGDGTVGGGVGAGANMATIAGSAQRTRCGYFQDATKPATSVAGSGCPVTEITATCRSSADPRRDRQPPSDMAVALAALDATVAVRPRRPSHDPDR